MSALSPIPSKLFKNPIPYEQFKQVVILIGRAIKVEPNTNAKIPAYLLHLTFGQRLDNEHKSLFKKERFISSAQLCANHAPEDIENYLVMSVVNFPRKQIGKFKSDCLVTGAQKAEGTPDEKRETTVYLRPTKEVEGGKRISVKGCEEEVSSLTRDLSWEVFTTLDLRIGTVLEYGFSDLGNMDLMHIKGKVCLDKMGTTSHFIGLVHRTFEVQGGKTGQLLFWVNPAPEEMSEISQLPAESIEKECVLLCTVDSGRAGVEPAKQVDNGFRIA